MQIIAFAYGRLVNETRGYGPLLGLQVEMKRRYGQSLNWVEQQKSVTKFGESDIKKKIFEYDDNHKSSS